MNDIVLTTEELNAMLAGHMTEKQREFIDKVKSMPITHHTDGSDEVEFEKTKE